MTQSECLFEVELPEDLIDKAEQAAKTLGISVTELVRRAIAGLLQDMVEVRK